MTWAEACIEIEPQDWPVAAGWPVCRPGWLSMDVVMTPRRCHAVCFRDKMCLQEMQILKCIVSLLVKWSAATSVALIAFSSATGAAGQHGQ